MRRFPKRSVGARAGLAVAVDAAARQRHAAGPHHFQQAVGPQHFDQAVDLVFGAGRLDHERIGADVDDAGAIHLDELHDMGALGPFQRKPGAAQGLAAVAHHRLGKLDVLHQLDRDIEMQHRHEPAVERQRLREFSRLG